jgi:hypothetical protein
VTHLATEYTHATIELRMLFLVARQQSAHQAAKRSNCYTERSAGGEEQAAVMSHASPRRRNKHSLAAASPTGKQQQCCAYDSRFKSITETSNQSVWEKQFYKCFKKHLYESVFKEQSSRSEFAKISQSARSELKNLCVQQCVIISDSDC